ncbi:MAG TPA: 6-phosphogluconolactonase [Chthoniobacterales bacterium]
MPEILRTTTFADTAARFILNAAGNAIADHGSFHLALSGGNTPKAVYQKLAAHKPDTSKWVITFGDERTVPPDHAQSNYKMATDAWLSQTAAKVLRIKGEIDPAAAADDYEAQLDAISPDFRHDLILLGMGDDGHTASLFPDTEALAETKRRVVANFVPKFDTWRITFTYPFINAAKGIAFLVNDPSKQPLIEAILAGGTEYPSEHIKPVNGTLTWVIGA